MVIFLYYFFLHTIEWYFITLLLIIHSLFGFVEEGMCGKLCLRNTLKSLFYNHNSLCRHLKHFYEHIWHFLDSELRKEEH